MSTLLAEPMIDEEKGPSTDAAPENFNDTKIRSLVQTFKLLSDETRLRILFFLFNEDELNVRTLCDMLEQSQPAVSHHLALLRVAGLIEARRDGKHNFYRLMPKRLEELSTLFFNVLPVS